MSLVLLAADMEGYSNLCQLVTLRHLGTTQLSQNMNPAETDGRPVTMQELAEHNHGVIALCPLPARSRDTSNRRGTIHRALRAAAPQPQLLSLNSLSGLGIS